MSYFDHTNQKVTLMSMSQLDVAQQVNKTLIESIYQRKGEFLNFISSYNRGSLPNTGLTITHVSFSGDQCYIKLENVEMFEHTTTIGIQDVYKWYLSQV